MTYNASNRKDIRNAEKSADRREKDRVEFIVAAMSTIQGRAWFHELLTHCHLFSDPFTGRALDEAYLKGERNVGLKLFADISAHCPNSYIQMMQEAQIKEITNDRRDLDNDDSDSGDSSAEYTGSEDPNG